MSLKMILKLQSHDYLCNLESKKKKKVFKFIFL